MEAISHCSDQTIKDWFDPKKPVEERREAVKAGVEPYIDFYKAQVDTDEVKAQGEWLEYMIEESCPEETDAPKMRAINDLHAAYAWMVKNADKLNIDPDKIVLIGNSSGGHLATALSFRLKRYGYQPRGCVVTMPITDDRMLMYGKEIKNLF